MDEGVSVERNRALAVALAALAFALGAGLAGYLGGRGEAEGGAADAVDGAERGVASVADVADGGDGAGGGDSAAVATGTAAVAAGVAGGDGGDGSVAGDTETGGEVAIREAPPAGRGDSSGVSVDLIVPGKASLGEPAPPFAMVTPDNGTVSLASLAGRPVVLNFFATWCIPCRAEMPLLEAAHREHGAAGLAVIGVDLREGPELVGPYLAELGLTFPVGLDRHGAVADAYRVSTLPTTYLIDANGEVAGKRVGPYHDTGELAADLRRILGGMGE